MHEAAPLVDIEFVQLLQDMLGDLEGNPEPIEVKIFGDDPDRLAELAGPGRGDDEQGSRASSTSSAPQQGNPEVTWTIDPVAAGRYGLTVEQVSDQLAGNWLGEVATDLRLPDRTVPVRVRLPDAYPLRSEQASADADPHTRRQADPGVGSRSHGARERPGRAEAREPAPDGGASAAASKGATWAAPSPRSRRT